MEKVKIAVWLDNNYIPEEEGGGFSYYDKLVQTIDNYQFDPSIELCFVTNSSVSQGTFSKPIIELSYVPGIFIQMMAKVPLCGKQVKQKYKKRREELRQKSYEKTLLEAGVRVIYYLCQGQYSVVDFPFIATNWDIGHCSTFAFPELIPYGNFEKRNNIYTQVLPKALMVFTESDTGKAELSKYTNIDEKKIKVVPLFAGNCVNAKCDAKEEEEFLSENQLEKQKFFFYPARFWAHKNHTGLLQAFAKFTKQYPDYKLVFTVSKEYLRLFASSLKIEDKVLFLDFLPVEQINILYRNATALVMATYLGPTNMPPIEAMELGCPVICSDLQGHHEILSNAAIYFNPMDQDELCNAMIEMINNRSFYKDAIEKQNRNSLFKIENSMQKLNEHLKEVAIIRNCWK